MINFVRPKSMKDFSYVYFDPRAGKLKLQTSLCKSSADQIGRKLDNEVRECKQMTLFTCCTKILANLIFPGTVGEIHLFLLWHHPSFTANARNFLNPRKKKE